MGRTMKRVALDFDWPLDKVWSGFINELHRPCPEKNRTCFDGQTGGSAWLERLIRLLALAGEESRGIKSAEDSDRIQAQYAERDRLYPHPYLTRLESAPSFTRGLNQRGVPAAERETPVYYLTPLTEDLADLIERASGEKLEGWSGDRVQWALRKKLIELAGLPERWGICPICDGNDLDPAVKEAYDAWQPTEPPTGPGYQLWETTSEGSPISPVFKTLDELCGWCEKSASTFADFRATAADWKKMLDDDRVVHQEGNMIFI